MAFVRLQHRIDSVSKIFIPEAVGGQFISGSTIIVPDDFFGTDAFTQLQFEKLVDDPDAPEVGYVISVQDLNNYELKDANGNLVQLFEDIWDGDGILKADSSNILIDYPIAALVDRIWNRVVLLAPKDDSIKMIKNFSDPIAVEIVDEFLYILDRETSYISIYKLSVDDSNNLHYSFLYTTNFSLNLSSATDISGFTDIQENILYVANAPLNSITCIILDKSTGLHKWGTDIISMDTIYQQGKIIPLGIFKKIETSPRIAGRNTLIAIRKEAGTGVIYAFSTDALFSGSGLTFNFKNVLPSGSNPFNIGYNLGIQAFYVTDNSLGKIHVLSNDGEYLGAGGSFGQSETNNELYYPNVVSNNTFTGTAIEMVVASKWGQTTGFKRLFPLAEIGALDVIETVPFKFEWLSANKISFRYTLTAGYGIDTIVIKLNGTSIETLDNTNSTFFPNRFSHEFVPSQLETSGALQPGWNTYEVHLTATNPFSNTQYQKNKSMQFFYIPSVIDYNFEISDNLSATIYHNKTTEPLYVYKSIFVPGDDDPAWFDFTISNGKTTLLWASKILVGKYTICGFLNEVFEFDCAATIQLIMNNVAPKSSTTCSFIQLKGRDIDCRNMVECLNFYPWSTTAPAAPVLNSPLNFTGCSFSNYTLNTTALFIGRCEAVAINTNFEALSPFGPDTTNVGIEIARGKVTIKGGEFLNNGMGIKSIEGNQVIVGHNTNTYQGTTVNQPLFENNLIGILNVTSGLNITNSNFTQNKTGIWFNSGNLQLKGGQMALNEIGIDAGSATVSIGNISPASALTVFENNDIAIQFIDAAVTAVNSQFMNNRVAIMALSGNIDLGSLKTNEFILNNRAIIFSNKLDINNGNNKFITNQLDILYIFPPVPPAVPEQVNLTCNYWQNNLSAPHFEYIASSNYDPSLLVPVLHFEPQLIQISTNAYAYVCKGPKSNNIELSPVSFYHRKFEKINDMIQNKFYVECRNIISQLLTENNVPPLGQYPNRNDTVQAYNEALIKNTAVSYLINKWLVDSVTTGFNDDLEVYEQLADQKPLQTTGTDPGTIYNLSQDLIALSHLDKMEFLKFFLIESSVIEPLNELSHNTDILSMYPNPLRINSKLELNISQTDVYSLSIYDLRGRVVMNIFDKTKLMKSSYQINLSFENYPPGVYMLHLNNSDNTINLNNKLILLD